MRSDSIRRCSVEPAVGSPAIATSIRSRTPGMCACGSRPQVWQRGARRSENGAAVRQRGQDRIGRTAGSTDGVVSQRVVGVESRGVFRYDAAMRMRTWLVVGLSFALSAAAGAKGPAKARTDVAPLMKALESESVEDAAKAAETL